MRIQLFDIFVSALFYTLYLILQALINCLGFSVHMIVCINILCLFKIEVIEF